jgi:hypothetical protein
MADFSGIQAVTATLRGLLLERMDEAAALTDVTTSTPRTDDIPDGPWVNLFLYRVVENAELRNQDLPGNTSPMALGHPPLSLDLHYLLTAQGLDAEDDRGAHRVLGDAMLTLHDHPVIAKDDPILDPVLQGEVELLKITFEPVGLEQLSNLWAATTAPYRLSVAYRVTVIQLESTRPRVFPKPVLEPPSAGPRVHAVPSDRPRIASLGVVRPPVTEETPVAYARVGDTLVIHGSAFYPGTRVLLDDVDVTADLLAISTAGTLRVSVRDDPTIGAGIHRLQLIRDVEVGDPARALPLMRSNVAAFVLVPAITGLSPTDGPSGTTVTVQGSRLLSDTGPTLVVVGDRPFAPEPGGTDTQMDVVVTGVPPAEYPVSVRVNGAESIDPHTFEVTP